MAIDISIVRDLDTFYTGFLEKDAQYFVYMARFSKDNSPYGKCPRCYDDTTGQITDARCPVCFGTGFTGGYDAPLTGPNAPIGRVLGILNANSIVTDWQPAGIIRSEEDQKIYLKMHQAPALSDMLIDPDGNRYRIGTHVEDWNWRGVQYGYVATVFQQSTDAMIYQVPVPAIPYVAQGSSPASSFEVTSKYTCKTQTSALT